MLRLRCQFNPTPQENALLADTSGLAKPSLKMSPSTLSSPTRAATSQAPQPPLAGLKFFLGTTGFHEFSSPVRKYEAATCQAVLLYVLKVLAPLSRRTSWLETTYSPNAPNGPQ